MRQWIFCAQRNNYEQLLFYFLFNDIFAIFLWHDFVLKVIFYYNLLIIVIYGSTFLFIKQNEIKFHVIDKRNAHC